MRDRATRELEHHAERGDDLEPLLARYKPADVALVQAYVDRTRPHAVNHQRRFLASELLREFWGDAPSGMKRRHIVAGLARAADDWRRRDPSPGDAHPEPPRPPADGPLDEQAGDESVAVERALEEPRDRDRLRVNPEPAAEPESSPPAEPEPEPDPPTPGGSTRTAIRELFAELGTAGVCAPFGTDTERRELAVGMWLAVFGSTPVDDLRAAVRAYAATAHEGRWPRPADIRAHLRPTA